ncbi:MAG: phage Gp37/Gp68 family protein [Treponema sp.]|nr:phage Gp37/Gp68 family protein [Treponema sp.]
MNPTKIDWCDRSWNPVTGCFYKCPYCYAKDIARRFGGHWSDEKLRSFGGNGNIHEIYEPMIRHTTGKNRYKPVHNVDAPYPYVFDPTFHAYRLNEPSQIKKPQNIFVCSMADLFGAWVPDEWIEKVFEACSKAPQHRYLFLTKNPQRYNDILSKYKVPDNFWFGTTVINAESMYFYSKNHNTFLSIEPIQSDFEKTVKYGFAVDWIIIGAETGNRKDKIIPKKEWIENIVNYCREKNVPVFMKNNLAKEVWRKDKKTGEMILVQPKIWDEPLIQEFPWDKEKEL